MLAEEIEKDGEDVVVQANGILKRLGAGMSLEACIANGESESVGREASFAEALAGFLGEMTEEGFHLLHVVCVFAEGVIVRDGFGFGVDQEFVGIAAARFAVERGAPLPEYFFQLLLGVGSELFDGFNAEGTESALRDFTDAGDFADGQRREEAGFHAGRDPNEAAGLGLIGSYLGDKTRGGEAAGTGKRSGLRDGAKEFVSGG